MIKAVIFDFNGTLYFDTDIHVLAWKKIYQEISDGRDDFEEVFKKIFGATNKEIIKHFYKSLDKEISDEECEILSKEKEKIYRRYSIEHDRCHLVYGAKELMDYLKENNYAINLSSASIIENINFFFEYFGIGKWMRKEKVTYDDGTYINKIKMYEDAARNINVSIEECLVFEDSVYGADCAKKAGCKNIVLLDPDDEKKMGECVIAKIKDFTEFDLSILKKY